MNTRTKSSRLLTLLAAGLLCTGGAYAAEPAAEPAAEAHTDAQADAQAEQPDCLQQTGSHLKVTEDRPCISAPGQVITREQIERTGAITVSDAIRRSSASVR